MIETLHPEPIDRERAKNDIPYFAEKYLDIKLFPAQITVVRKIMKGENATLQGIGKATTAYVATAMARHKGYKVKVVQKPINGEVVG